MQTAETTAAAVPLPTPSTELGEVLAVGWASLDAVFEPGGPLRRFVFDRATFRAALGAARSAVGGDPAAWRASDVLRSRVMDRLYGPAFRRVLRLAVRAAARRGGAEIAHDIGLRIAAQILEADYPAADCPVGRAIFEAAWARRSAAD